MKKIFKNKFILALIIFATLALAGMAVYTALKLNQTQETSISPARPESQPKAQVETSPTCQLLVFSLQTPTITPTPTSTSTASPTATPTLTPTPTTTATSTPGTTLVSCNGSCDTSSDCKSGLSCSDGVCRNPTCLAETDCTCPVTQATTEPSMPNAGVSLPTVLGISTSIFLLIISLALAL